MNRCTEGGSVMLHRNIKKIWKDEAGLSYKIEYTLWEFKKAHQRFWRGYDDSLVWGMNTNLLYLIRELIVDLKETHVGHPMIKGEVESDEDWVRILDEMLINIDRVEYYENRYYGDWDNSISNGRKRKFHQDEFFKLFTKYYDELWD